ncbi:MAG: type 2 isopentenyl-diphosphate Delta-isomerase [Thermoanaerobacterales bacterium]|jgi:isopentenyl-diphosphate delta-isomerase|nr:type 2 isopentenyl-diphosphate Delta-isomerase [Thermoanaerobacterales bacterium]
MDKRRIRKIEHVKYSLMLENRLKRNNFDDIVLLNNCLSEVDLDEIDLTTNLQGLRLENPIIINAMTGGFFGGEIINRQLSKIAKNLKLAMAVGSQKIAVDNPLNEKSFKIVREINPDGIIFANIGADASIDDVNKAINMLNADALQIHLNVPQELAMKEGRKKFKGTLDNIKSILNNVDVPVVVKEVGFGISGKQALTLVKEGIKILDVSGKGGTNFISVENKRNRTSALKHLESWGIPTPVSIIDVNKAVGDRADIIASGGLFTGADCAKCFALGAKAAAFAGSFLYILKKKGPRALHTHVKQILKEIKHIMVMTGSKNLKELRRAEVRVLGNTFYWLKSKDIIR